MPFKPNKETSELVKRFSRLIRKIGDKCFYATFGGLAIDGHAGRLTRNHDDVDMLCFREDVGVIEGCLSNLGYPHEQFVHPQEPDFIYKIRTNDKDRSFTFQMVDQKPKDKFEITFYRFPHLVYPVSYIKPPDWLKLEGLHLPAVKKEFLIKLKTKEIDFFEKEKKENPTKYYSKHEQKHLHCLHDIKLLTK